MPRTAVVTDSSACLPDAVAARLPIRVLPIGIHLPDRDLHDGMAEAGPAVYEALRSGRAVKSSAPTAAEYLHSIEEAGADEVLVVTPAREFTGMYRSASAAAQIAGRPVHVLDCRTAAAAQGLVVLAAAEEAQAGGNAADVSAVAEDAARRAELVAALDGVGYLRQSGRVPPFALELARRLGVRPVFRFRDGQAERVGVPRSPDAALRRIRSEWAARSGRSGGRSAVFHAQAAPRAEALARLLGRPMFIVEFSPSMGIHTGPGVVGVAWLRPTG